MTVDRLRQLPRDQLTFRRIVAGLLRRAAAIPHNVAYWNQAGPGSPNEKRIAAFRDRHQGDRCFVLGNGPSLAKTDLSKIGSATTFGLNRIFLLSESAGFRPDYFVCMNGLVLEQSRDEIHSMTMPRFLNWSHHRLFPDREGLIFLRETFTPHFSVDLAKGVWGGATVTFVALQIAYYLGFQQVVLVGVDHRYLRTGIPHRTVVGGSSDPDHFDPNYFPPGFRWQLPDLTTSEFAYKLARDAFKQAGREVMDATVDGELDVFPKIKLEDLD